MAKASTERPVKFSGSWVFKDFGKFTCVGQGQANSEIEITVKYVDLSNPYKNPDLTGDAKEDDSNLNWISEKQTIKLT